MGLVRKRNAEPGQGSIYSHEFRGGQPEACICCVSSLENEAVIMLRIAPCRYMLQVTQRGCN